MECGFGSSRSILPYHGHAFVLSASLHQHIPVLLPLAFPFWTVLRPSITFLFCFQTLLQKLINCALFLDPSFCPSTLVLIISSVLWALLWSYKLNVSSLRVFFSPSSSWLCTGAKLRSFYCKIPVLGSAPPSQANIGGLLQKRNSTAFSVKQLEWSFVLERQIARIAFQPYPCKNGFSRAPASDVDCQQTTELCPNMTHGLSD